MDDFDLLPTDLLVSAQTRLAAQEGVPIVVRRRGDDASGAILLKVNRLDGTADILMQARDGDRWIWSPAKSDGPMDEGDAESYLEKQATFDPDLWLIEIEDRKGRHWFPGRIKK